jgi:molecular chaperone DnaJ
MKDYYQILGVPRGASHDDIKKAFRKLAHEHHPDKQGGNEAKFKEANEAYSVLGDAEKRKRYDTFGSADAHAGGGGFGGGQGFGGFDFSGFSQGFGNGDGVEFDLGDVFSSFFGGGGRQPKKGKDIRVMLEISFKDAVFGSKQRIELHMPAQCTTCKGTGAAEGSKRVTCKTCNGAGKKTTMKQTILGAVRTSAVCDACHGVGTVPEKPCPTCKGSGVHRRDVSHEIDIPAGANDGEEYVIRGKGEAAAGLQSGDLFIRLRVQQDKRFKRHGADLHSTVTVPLSSTLVGETISFAALDETIDVTIPACSRNGDEVIIKGKGVPQGRSRGNLVIHLDVKMPRKANDTIRKLAEELKKEGN